MVFIIRDSDMFFLLCILNGIFIVYNQFCFIDCLFYFLVYSLVLMSFVLSLGKVFYVFCFSVFLVSQLYMDYLVQCVLKVVEVFNWFGCGVKSGFIFFVLVGIGVEIWMFCLVVIKII